MTKLSTIRLRERRPSGFALITTLVMMILLVVIAVGLLSLSSISLRTGDQQRQMRTAQANARLAMMLAISELQKELGPDQRITATSGILENPANSSKPKHPGLTGVWNSRDDTLGGTAPTYGPNEGFRRWLVSSSDSQALAGTAFASSGSFQDPVDLVSARTPAAPSGSFPVVQAGRIRVQGANTANKGKLAWWVGDENCKGFLSPTASVRQQSVPNLPSVPDVLANSNTPGAHGMQAVDLNFPSNTADTAKILTHGQVALASTKDRATTAAWFHDLSPYPCSVLSNVTKGGLRQDLSLFLEQASLDLSNADGTNKYPWPAANGPTGPLGPNSKIALSDVGEYDVLPWKQLAAWIRLRDKIDMVNDRPTLLARKGDGAATTNDYINPRWNARILRPVPIPIRCLLFCSFGTVSNAEDNAVPLGQLAVRLYIYPVIVLWNPFNIDLTTQETNLLFTNMPLEFQILKNGTVAHTYQWQQYTGLQPYFDASVTVKAGETKILTPTQWRWDGALHIAHKMAPNPIVFTRTRGIQNGAVGAGGEWGAGASGYDPRIPATGTDAEELQVKPIVRTGISMNGNQSTFDIRSHHCALEAAQWGTFLWHAKLGWRFDPDPAPPWSPDKTNSSASVKDTFGGVKNAPRPFMVVDIKLKTLDENEIPNKTWAHCIPGHPFQGVTNTGGITPHFLNAYKLTFNTVSDDTAVANYLQFSDAANTQTYFGTSNYANDGQPRITDVEIPLAPLTSLAQLQNLPQGSIDNLYSSGFYFQNHAIGNSFANPGVPADAVKKTDGPPFWVDQYYNTYGGTINATAVRPLANEFLTRPNIDRSYAANHLLWDDYFFSSMAPKNGKLVTTGSRTLSEVLNDFYLNNKPLPNERYRPYLYKPAASILTDLISGSNPTDTAHKKVAGSLLVDGGFNINSVSINAWKTLLASAHKRPMAIMDSTGKPEVKPEGSFIVSRFTMPNAPSAGAGTGQAAKNLRWTGYRELTEPQIDSLAKAIVRQVKTRGPFRSLGEFINRRLGTESDPLTRYGALQAALEDPAVDINADYRADIDAASLQSKQVTYANQTAATGSKFQGTPACISQADLLGPIAPILNARSDTFVIRAYGEATGSNGPAARAWCEAVVQRVPDYMDATNPPETELTSLNTINKTFGRRLQIVNFRWLTASEV